MVAMSDIASLPPPLNQIFDRFLELHGDRTETDVTSVHAGFAWIGAQRVVLLVPEATRAESYSPPAYRKMRRFLGLAVQLRRPVLFWGAEILLPRPHTSLANADGQHQFMLEILRARIPLVSVVARELSLPTDFVVPLDTQPSHEQIRASLEEILTRCVASPIDELLERRRQWSARHASEG